MFGNQKNMFSHHIPNFLSFRGFYRHPKSHVEPTNHGKMCEREFSRIWDYLSRKIFENCSEVDRSTGARSLSIAALLQKPSDPTNGELEPRLDRLRHRLLPISSSSSSSSPCGLRGLHCELKFEISLKRNNLVFGANFWRLFSNVAVRTGTSRRYFIYSGWGGAFCAFWI